MKNILIFSLLMAGISLAEFESWTNKDGKQAELELLSVTENNGEKSGSFKMRNGKTVTLKASDLSAESAEKLGQWQPPAPEPEAAPSIFDEVLDGNLERLSGKRLKKCTDATKPAKYYVFYYTASWCGPCQQFTPSLVDWYKKNKNDNFELVLITSDRDEESMEQYAAAKKMPWPQLKLRKVEDFKKKFQHGVSGIPSVIVCDIDGKNLGNYRSNLDGITELVKD